MIFGLYDEAYAYDPVGNRTASHTSGSMAYSYEGDAGNLLLSDDTYDYQYDDMGNLTRRALKSSGAFDSFHYNHRNLLVAIERFDSDGDLLSRCEYGYDPLNRRIRSLEAGVEHFYVFDDHNPLILGIQDGVLPMFGRRLL